MATISSAGVGSGLDIEGIISSLMAVERKPITQIQTQQSGLRSDISAYGRVQGALSALQSATQSLKTGSAFAAAKAKSSDDTLLTARPHPAHRAARSASRSASWQRRNS